MIDLGTLRLAIKVDNKEANKELDGFKNKTNGISNKLKGLASGAGKAAGTIAKGAATAVGAAVKATTVAVGAASTAISGLAAIGINYNKQMETYVTNFSTMLGSQEAATQKVNELKELAAKTPLAMDDLAQGTQTLLAFGVESENSTQILRQLGDIALGDADKMNRMATAFGKATAQGKVTGEVVQQMVDAGFNPLLEISKKTGESMEDLQKRMSEGGVSVQELEDAMESATSAGGQFEGGMEAASKTTEGLISTLTDNAQALVGEVFMPISEGLVQEVLPGAINAIDTLTSAFKENGISGMITAASDIVANALTTFTQKLPDFINMAFQIVQQLVNGIQDNLPLITEGAITAFSTFISGLVSMLPQLADMGYQMVFQLATWIDANVDKIVDSAVDLFMSLIDTMIKWLPKLIPLAAKIVAKLALSLIQQIPELVKKVAELGDAIVQGIINGISAAWNGLVSWFNGLWDSLFGGRSVDVNVNTNGSHRTGLREVPYDGYIAELHKGEMVLTSYEAKQYQKGKTSDTRTGNIIVNNYSPKALDEAESARLFRKSQRQLALGVV